MTKAQIIEHIEALKAFHRYELDTGRSAGEVVDEAELVMERQAPASFNDRYPAPAIRRIAAYMVKHHEPAERAYLFA